MADRAEAVVVGAGAAGSLAAAKLAQAGKQVVVLEAGPAWNQGDLVSSQMWARRLRWGGPFVGSTGEHPFAFDFNAGWGWGGAALHHYGTWPRFHEEDFRTQSLYGRGVDWPFDYAELQHYYDRIQEAVGISGDATAEKWRGAGTDYPMPPLEIFAQARLIARGFEALGMHTAPMPMAINSVEYNGRAPCIYDGWCDAGCPIGALVNPLVTSLADALAAGADVREKTYVTRLIPASRTRAAGVEYADAEGNRQALEADVVILAASVVHNPTILLNSANDLWPEGAANAHGRVGQGFMCHAVASVFGFWAENTENHMGVTGAQLSCRDGYKKDMREDAFGSYHWLIAPAVKPNDLLGIATSRADIFGAPLHDFMQRAVKHLGNMIAMVEELPEPDNRVALSDRTGPLGTKLPTITHRFSQDALATWAHAKAEGLRVFEAAGATESWNGPLATAHMMGGTPMGDDPAASVTDSYGRAHEIENLVILGPGLFPTGAAINPNFTNHAVALRALDQLTAHWSDYAG